PHLTPPDLQLVTSTPTFILFFFPPPRPPPTSPLFPYTTLFRSFHERNEFGEGLRTDSACVDFLAGIVEAAEKLGLHPVGGGFAGDRKSTRLNSSHGSISYAVFCLKKKNNKQITNYALRKDIPAN